MRNKELVNFLKPNYSPFFYDQSFEDDLRESFFRDFNENDKAYFTSVDMPGVNSDDINIDIEDSYIRITAERKDAYNNSAVMKKYDHAISIPKNVDRENISAHYENGVLNLALQKIKLETSKKKKIAVSTGEKPSFWSKFLNVKKDDSERVEESNKKLN